MKKKVVDLYLFLREFDLTMILQVKHSNCSENNTFHHFFFNDKFTLLELYLELRGHFCQPGQWHCIIKSTLCLIVLEKGQSIFPNLLSKFLATEKMKMGHGRPPQRLLKQLSHNFKARELLYQNQPQTHTARPQGGYRMSFGQQQLLPFPPH